MSNVLIIEESPRWRAFLSEALADDYSVSFWPDGQDMGAKLSAENSDAVILDVQTSHSDPLELLKQLKEMSAHTPVLMTSETEKAELVVEAMRAGASDFIPKPYSPERIKVALAKSLETQGLKHEIDYLRRQQDVVYSFDRVVAFSTTMKEVVKKLQKFAETDATILVTGETGTGKSFLSGSIHFNSRRRSKPFIKINCTNIPETLLESELFGHERGAFTGANKTRVGRFEQANGGTVFLDEIGEMTLDLQAKLLRVLDDRSFERVGGNKTIHSDVRIIAATNRVLEERVGAGKFREDFYYRINVLTLHLPPLRERRACIRPLAKFLLDKTCRSLRKSVEGFAPDVMEMLEDYDWPGNIRQLANTVERAVILEEGPVITRENVSFPKVVGKTQPEARPPATTQPLHEREKEAIFRALEESLWIQKDAADRLGISPRALNYKIRKLGITHPRWRKNK